MGYIEWLSGTWGAPAAPVGAQRPPGVLVAVECLRCGEMMRTRIGRGRVRRFCDDCNRQRHRGRQRAGYLSPSKQGTCAECDSPMVRGSTSLPQGEARCLSCRRARPAKVPTESPRPVAMHCRRCDGPLNAPSRSRRYCSVECFRKARNARGSGGRKPSTTERGYGEEHRRLRTATVDAAVGTPCVLCGEVMDDPARMHLDHTEDRTGYRGFAHDRCNVLDGARRGGQATRSAKLAKGRRR